MSALDNKQAEQRGYSRGYVAGRKRLKADESAEHLRRERQAFLDKAFLATLPMALEQSTWTRGDKPIKKLKDRVQLAWEIAEAALLSRRCA
jgi:hypothetical protein